MPKVVCVASKVLPNWFCIERAEHDGSTELVETAANCYSVRYAGRISDADIEGTGAEMLEIADAIDRRSSYGAKRCAVEVTSSEVRLWSPRNSSHPGVISLSEADELAKTIRQLIRKWKIGYLDREYAKLVGDPVLAVVVACSKEKAEAIAKQRGLGETRGVWAYPDSSVRHT